MKGRLTGKRRNAFGVFLKKTLAATITASLLIAQQGFSFSRAAAASFAGAKVNIAAPGAGSISAGAGGVFQGAASISLGNLRLSPPGIGGQAGVLPSVNNFKVTVNGPANRGAVAVTGKEIGAAVSVKSVQLPAAAAAAGASLETSGVLSVNPAATGRVEASVQGRMLKAVAKAEKGDEIGESVIGHVGRLVTGLFKAPAAGRRGLLGIFYDRTKARKGALHTSDTDAVDAAEGDFGRNAAQLRKQPTLQELREVLVDGTVGEHGRIEAFGFRTPTGEYVKANGAGLETFFDAKQTHTWKYGHQHSIGQIYDYFNYIDALLEPMPWTLEMRRELRTLKQLAVDDRQKNKYLNKFILKTLTGLQKAEVAALMEGVDAPSSMAEASLEIDPKRKYHPSPEDWRDEVVYFAVIDRFARSKRGMPRGDPQDGGSRHGGDIKGIIEKLGYIEESGVTAILLNPIMMGLPKAYHGYAPLHLLAVDPQLGSMEDYKTLVAEAHKRGIRVIMDLVLNHAGPVFEYKDGSRWSGMENPRKEINGWAFKLSPKELADPKHFSRRGVIDDWNHPDQVIKGDFPPNYRHYRSDSPETAELLIKVAQWWLKETDVDGFRMDAIRHVDPSFWPRFSRELREYAAELGKTNFFLLGENSTGVDWELLPYMNDAGFNSTYNYPAYRRDNRALHGAAPTKELEESANANMAVLGAHATRLLRFIDLHDTYRFLRTKEPVSILKLAMAYLLFSIGIPIVYAGTEQAFRQYVDTLDPEGPALPADPQNREDMFAEGRFKSESSKGDKFDQEAPTYKYLRLLSDLRKKYPALRRGEQYPRWSDPYGAGIYAFSRIYEGEEVIVVMNTSGVNRSANMWVDAELSPGGTVFVDELDADWRGMTETPDSEGGSKLNVVVPPNGVRVLVQRPKKR